jgi:chromosome partitioning protein
MGVGLRSQWGDCGRAAAITGRILLPLAGLPGAHSSNRCWAFCWEDLPLRTIAVANFKGGTGKTATCHALGTVLAKEHGWPVLLMDCDPQSSLTGACGVNDTAGKSLAEMFDGSFRTPLELELFMYHIIRKVQPNLDLGPADIAMARRERRLALDRNGPVVLREALRTLTLRYGVAVLDCPPPTLGC